MSIWMRYITAYGAIVHNGQVAKGDHGVITAASSSVGIAAIQIAKAEGAIVIATTRGAAKKAELIAAGGGSCQYFAPQAADSLTLSYAMMDSSVGQAAWILDKYLAWSDRRGRETDPLFDWDHAITEIMIFLVTDTFYTATSSTYQSIAAEGPITLPAGARIEVPVGFAAFPDTHCPPPPEEFVRKSHNVVRYSTML